MRGKENDAQSANAEVAPIDVHEEACVRVRSVPSPSNPLQHKRVRTVKPDIVVPSGEEEEGERRGAPTISPMESESVGFGANASVGVSVSGAGTSYDKYSRPTIDWRALMHQRYEDVSVHYKVDKRVLGEGGYGSVHVARDIGVPNGRLVAIKKVVKRNPLTTEAFHREIQVMKELDHPNICRLLETFEDQRHIFFVMEFCEGGELFDRIVDNKVLNESVAANVARQVVGALRYCHLKEIAHRDLKPENICFCSKDPDPMGQVKLIDWGLCGLLRDEGMMKTAVGSLTYCAPEVLSRTSYDHRCDLWSFGVVTYVMLCGMPPFWGNKAIIVDHIKRGIYPMDGEVWESVVSDKAKDFVRRFMCVDVDRRMTSEEALAHPWLTKTMQLNACPVATGEIMENLKRFNDATQFRALCITAVARVLGHRQLKDVHAVFRRMDSNDDGQLSLSEVQEGFKELVGHEAGSEEEINKWFESMDTSRDGLIDYTEFCSAAINHQCRFQDDVLWCAFRSFDASGDGEITVEELMETLMRYLPELEAKPELCRQHAVAIVSKYDQDGDRRIDFPEFKKLLRCTSTTPNDMENFRLSHSGSDRDTDEESEGDDKAYNKLLQASGLVAGKMGEMGA